MRIAVVLLVGLGLLAAVCATVLVRVVMRPRVATTTKIETDPEVTLLTATKPLSAMTVVDGTAVVTKKVRKSELPEGALTNSVQVVGKVVTRPMVEGEAFSKSCFASDSLRGVYLASAVPEGKRAVAISLQESSVIAGILYPGGVVDVLVSLENANGAGAVATTLLQGLQVLAIGSQTVTAEQQYQDKAPGALAKKDGSINYRMVTLLVTPKQAEILQLATQHGTVTLSMRNPLDTRTVNHQLTRVSEFTESGKSRFGDRLTQMAVAMMENSQKKATTKPAAVTAVASSPPPTDPFAPPSTGNASTATNPLWEMLIVRGTDTEKRTFPMTDVDQPAEEEAPLTSVVPGKG